MTFPGEVVVCWDRHHGSDPRSFEATNMDAEFAFDLSHTEQIMQVISREKGESLVIGDNIIITVVEIRGDKVRLGG